METSITYWGFRGRHTVTYEAVEDDTQTSLHTQRDERNDRDEALDLQRSKSSKGLLFEGPWQCLNTVSGKAKLEQLQHGCVTLLRSTAIWMRDVPIALESFVHSFRARASHQTPTLEPRFWQLLLPMPSSSLLSVCGVIFFLLITVWSFYHSLRLEYHYPKYRTFIKV